MATYHCSVKHGTVGIARPHANYICREGKYGTAKMKEQLVYKESGNMPSFVGEDQLDYWDAADEFTRINGRTYEEFELALPQELSDEDNLKLVKAFIAEEVGETHAYTFAIHSKPAANDREQRQIHAHIMYSPKVQDGIERSREKFFKQYYAKEPERQGAKNDTRFSKLTGKMEISNVRLRWEQWSADMRAESAAPVLSCLERPMNWIRTKERIACTADLTDMRHGDFALAHKLRNLSALNSKALTGTKVFRAMH